MKTKTRRENKKRKQKLFLDTFWMSLAINTKLKKCAAGSEKSGTTYCLFYFFHLVKQTLSEQYLWD
jgi:hypothetical protein